MAGNSASSYSEMDGIQKAAILLITLGPEKAAVVFKHLKEDEIEQLTLEIANTRSVTPAQKGGCDSPPEQLEPGLADTECGIGTGGKAEPAPQYAGDHAAG